MEFKIGGGQMKKVKGIIGLSMSLIISLGITANVSAGTKISLEHILSYTWRHIRQVVQQQLLIEVVTDG